MNLACAILLSIFNFGSIQEVKIDDKGVIKALNVYVDSLNKINDSLTDDFHLEARVENRGATKIIYINAVIWMSSFKLGLPDKYSKLGNRLVFWYERKDKVDSEEAFKEFQHQFGSLLVNNLKPDGSFDSGVNPSHIKYYGLGEAITTYRFVIIKDVIRDIREVCRFPNKWFYQNGFVYDKNGDLMHQNGVYDLCALDKSFELSKYDPLEYFISKGMSIGAKQNVWAQITIGKNGKTSKVEIVDKQRALTEEVKERYKDIILHMPPWNIATVKGVRVSYIINWKL